ncbi:MAG: acyl carrier protein [Phycisphaeraceae bacterium]|nr:acyl carrier protein [Phycisphaeraceae bacterium]
MPSTETLSRVKGVIRRCLKVDEQTLFEDTMPLVGGEYDLDSLDILLIVTELEKEFGVKITDGSMSKAAFTNVTTLGLLIEGLPQDGSKRG